MSLKLSFTKVNLLSFSRKPAAGSAKFSAAATKKVSDAMGWSEFGDTFKSVQPTGMLAASLVELTPTDDKLAKQALELNASTVRDFELVRVQVKKGKTANKNPTFKTELHFVVDFSDPNGARKLETYMLSAGESILKVTYEKQAELELEPTEPEPLTEEQKKRAAGKDE